MTQNEITKSSFWKRPGGKIGTILPIFGLGISGWFLLPILTTIIWNTINFGIACGVGFALYLFLFTKNRLKTFIGIGWELLMRGIVNIFDDIDPFIIGQKKIDKARSDRENIKVEAQKVLSVGQKLKGDVDNKLLDMRGFISSAKNASNKGDIEYAKLYQNKAERAKSFVDKVSPLSDKLNNIGNSLLKVYSTSLYTIEDMQDELNNQRAIWDGLTAGNKALTSFQRMWKGDPADFAMQQQSAENLKNKIAEKVVGMTIGMNEVGNFMKTIDYNTGNYDEAALKKLEASTVEMVSIPVTNQKVANTNKFSGVI